MPLPVIHITPPIAPSQTGCILPILADECSDSEDPYRPRYLSPPIFLLPLTATPLQPKDSSRRSSSSQCKPTAIRSRLQGPDLRIAVARRVHSGRQAERRAKFLAKIGAPPSHEATLLPATPPDSPALFHFSLPSPGMVSPLALFETVRSGISETHRCEKVNFRAQMPSLEEISSRLNVKSSSNPDRPSIALPDFLSLGKRCRQTSFGDSYSTPLDRYKYRRERLTEANLRAFDQGGHLQSIACR